MVIIWLSANKFGYELLKEAVKLKNIKINYIITLSDKAKTIMYDSIEREKWYEFGIKVFEIENIRRESELLRVLSPDLVIVCGWRQIIDEALIKIPRGGFLGFHPTLLPLGRGPAPIINSILEGFKESGVSMFYLDKGLDSGDIIGQEKIVIEESDHAQEVYDKVILAGIKLIKTSLPLLARKKAFRKPQDYSKATFFKKLTLKDNQINFETETIDRIYRKIKAFSKPYRGAYVLKDGKKLIIWKAELKG